MKVIEYLDLLTREYIRRAAQELGLDVSVMYGENDQGGYAEVYDSTGRGISLQAEHPLMAQDDQYYLPKIDEEQWKLFCMEVKPWRYSDAGTSSV